MKPIGRASGSDHRGRERVAARSARTARNRRTRTRMYGGVGGGRGNPPADPIRVWILSVSQIRYRRMNPNMLFVLPAWSLGNWEFFWYLAIGHWSFPYAARTRCPSPGFPPQSAPAGCLRRKLPCADRFRADNKSSPPNPPAGPDPWSDTRLSCPILRKRNRASRRRQPATPYNNRASDRDWLSH